MLNVDLFLQTLPMMGKGMLMIFLVIAVIYLCILALRKVFR